MKIVFIKSLLPITLMTLCSFAHGEDKKCAELGRINAIESIKTLIPGMSQTSLLNDICSQNNLKNISPIGGKILPTKSELNALKNLLCAGQKKNKKIIKRSHKVLKKLLSRKQQKSFDSCVHLQEKGVKVSPKLSGETSDFVQLNVSLTNKSVTIRQPTILPAGAFTCSGPLMERMDNWQFKMQNMYLNCQRNKDVVQAEGATITIPTSKGNLSLHFAPQLADIELEEEEEFQYHLVNRPRLEYTPAPLPSIPSCVAANASDLIGRVLTCSVRERWQECNAQMAAGNVVDCKAVFPPQVLEGVREVQSFPAEGEYDKRLSGALLATVYKSNPGRGFVEGRIDYRINFRTPTPRQRSSSVCDPSCPRAVCGDTPCNRRCAFADQVIETTSYFGPQSVRGIPEPSCDNAAEGSIMQENIDRIRAYALCEHRQAWGQTITGVFYAQVSKFYWMHDMRTTHITARSRNSYREIWSMIDPGERWRSIARLEIPVSIQCIPQ